MAHITYRNRSTAAHRAASDRRDQAPVTAAMSTIMRPVRQTIVKIGRLLLHAAQAVAEARRQRALIEVELYLNRYKHASKNDDDLPIVR
jgi:hypothetical protein